MLCTTGNRSAGHCQSLPGSARMVTTFLLNYSEEVLIRKRIKHSLFLLFGLQNKKAPIDLLFLEFHIDNDCGNNSFPHLKSCWSK